MKEWVFRANELERGILSVSMYEVTDGVSTDKRDSIRLELGLEEVLSLQEEVNRVLAYHLRIMR
jgi:hypothetical protein